MEARTVLRTLASDELTPSELAAIRVLLVEAFGVDEDERFEESDWEHALGGTHFVLEDAGEIVAHAAVVERELHVGGRPVRTGYVEAVATASACQGKGFGTLVMRGVGASIASRFELGALGTGVFHFYERLGWLRWLGPSSVRMPDGATRPTTDDDGYLMVLATPSSPTIDLTAPISCEWRPGDVW